MLLKSCHKSLFLLSSSSSVASLIIFKHQLKTGGTTSATTTTSISTQSFSTSSAASSRIKTRATYTGVPMLSSIYSYFFNNNSSSLSLDSGSQQQQLRSYATNNPNVSLDYVNTFHPRLVTIFHQLDAIAPRFLLNKGDIEILSEPAQFYQTLKTKISQAKQRVYLSSLYIGKTQYELVECIDDALAKNQDLKVYLLTDVLRATREAPHHPSSASLLAPLEQKYGKHRVDIRMYHTPNLTGLTKKLAPKRLDEGWGVQHMKLYGFDDEIILSGANLSEDYFTNRQDRYYLFKSKLITDYYFRLHQAIASISYQIRHTTQLKQGFKLVWPTTNASCEPHINTHRFLSDASHLLLPILKQHELTSFDEFKDHENFDTIVYPVSQFTPLFLPNQDLSTEKPAILRLLSYIDSPKIRWWFTAGYFNMLPQIQDRLINSSAQGSVITASPKANSFYKSSGLSYYLPEAYLLFAKRFLEQVKKLGKETLITVYEWQNGVVNTPGGWTYHAKGLWLTVPEEEDPSITVIGSSNYTKRAYSCDLESNAIIITKDDELKQAMKHEIDHLMEHVSELTVDDFQPKPLLMDAAQSGVVIQDIPDEKLGGRDEDLEKRDKPHHPKYAIDEDRRISYRVHLAVKLLGGKL